MAFTRPDNNVSIWRGKPDLLQDQSSTVKADFDRLLNENSDDLITVIGELEATGDTSGADQIGGPTGTVGDHLRSTSNPHAVTAAQTGAYTKAETDAEIDQKVVDIGSSDMVQAVYDPQHIEADIFDYVDGEIGSVLDVVGEVQSAAEYALGIANDAVPISGDVEMTGELTMFASDSLTNEIGRNTVFLAVGASSSGVSNNTLIGRY